MLFVHVARRLALPILSVSRGLPVRKTASLKVAVATILSPMAYWSSVPARGLDVIATPVTVGGVVSVAASMAVPHSDASLLPAASST